MTAPTLPLVILAGFLGSGKTTLLQRILAEDHGNRILVVQSEFSSMMGIESVGMRMPDGSISSDVFEAPNGCLCCSAKDNVVATIERVLHEKPNYFTHILVEASGVADPTSLMESFWLDDALESPIKLEGVIALVDAKNFSTYLVADTELSNTDLPDDFANNLRALEGTDKADMPDARAELVEIGVRQIAAASKIVLNKIDLVSNDTQLESLKKLLRSMNPVAPILECEKAQIPLAEVWNLKGFGVTFDSLALLPPSPPHLEHGRASKVRCKCFTYPVQVDEKLESTKAVTASELEDFVGSIVWNSKYGKVIRVKGLFLGKSAEGRPELLTLQGVGEVFETRSVTHDGETRKLLESNGTIYREMFFNRLLLIGLSLDDNLTSGALQNFFLIGEKP